MRTQKTGKEQIGKEQIGNGQIGNEHIPTLYTHYKFAREGTVRVQSKFRVQFKFAGNEQMPTKKKSMVKRLPQTLNLDGYGIY